MDHPQILHTPVHLRPKIIPVEVFDFVVFGGTGDLALRKLMPALYYRFKDQQMPEASRVIGTSRKQMTREAYVNLVPKHIAQYVGASDFVTDVWERFASRLDFVCLGGDAKKGLAELRSKLEEVDARIRVFYLSVPPDTFSPLCVALHGAGLITAGSRVVIEKPIGHSLDTARRINDEIGAVFRENQTYRIDHYLGKETVQNLMALRFANSLFEPLWNRNFIDHIQITVAETIGIGTRGNYYDRSGALRDMIQNHLLQLLCLAAMEPPKAFEADAVRDEKLKVLHSLRPISSEDIKTKLVMGQYREGAVNGQLVAGYLEEQGIDPHSATETYVAIKAEVENWRWAGVPFYLRTGKRLPLRTSEIVIEFEPVPHLIFPERIQNQVSANRMIIRLQPDEGIRLYLMTKVPGPGGFRMQAVPLNLSFAEAFKMRYPDGYERLVMDVVRGNQTLFMRRDEVEAAWVWAEGLLTAWENLARGPYPYSAGTWGPTAAIALIERDGRTWYEDGL